MFNGSYLKQLRLNKKYTLAQLSQIVGCTPSFLSQIERGLRAPSLDNLRKLSDCLEVSVVSFFTPETNPDDINAQQKDYYIIRKDERRVIQFPGAKINIELITPLLSTPTHPNHQLQGTIYSLKPKEWYSEEFLIHTYDECTYILHGRMLVLMPQKEVYLEEGDCIYITASTLHNFRNDEDDCCTVLSFF